MNAPNTLAVFLLGVLLSLAAACRTTAAPTPTPMFTAPSTLTPMPTSTFTPTPARSPTPTAPPPSTPTPRATSTATPMSASTAPNDFRILYEWQEGSLPPPYHYEYTITIEPDGRGQIVMVPDYPSDDVPTWTETFDLSRAELDTLYRFLMGQGLFTHSWRAQDDPPVGGSSQSLIVTAHEQEIVIPSYVIPAQDAAAREISAAIVAMVPKPIWEKLNAQREQYVQANQ